MNRIRTPWTAAVPLMVVLLLAHGAASAQYVISTLAATAPGAPRYLGNGVAVDPAGNVYATAAVPVTSIPGQMNPAILRIAGGAAVPVVGGPGAGLPFPGCTQAAINVGMTDVAGVSVDSAGTIYVYEGLGNGPLLRVSGGQNSCLLGAGYFFGNSIVADNSGDAYFSAQLPNQTGYVVQVVTPAGARQTVAGTGVVGCSGWSLNSPQGLALDGAGNLYIADSGCHLIWKVTQPGQPGATLTAVAGNGKATYAGDGQGATSASINQPHGVAVDPDGNLFIADTANHRVRVVSGGVINTIAGTGSPGLSGDGLQAIDAQLQFPWGIAVGPGGVIYVGDQTDTADPNSRIRQLTPPGAMMVSPAPGSVLERPSVSFRWTGLPPATQYRLDVSDKIGPIGQGDILAGALTSATSLPVANLPCDGRAIYVQLQTQLASGWLNPGRYSYTACRSLSLSATPASVPAQTTAVNVALTVRAVNFWPEAVQLNVAQMLSLTPPPCTRNPLTGALNCPPASTPVGTPISLTPGESITHTYTVPFAPLRAGYTYAISHYFVATLAAPGGAVVATTRIEVIQY